MLPRFQGLALDIFEGYDFVCFKVDELKKELEFTTDVEEKQRGSDQSSKRFLTRNGLRIKF